MAESKKLQDHAKSLGGFLASNLAAHLLGELVDKTVSYIAEKLHPNNKGTLLPSGSDGHPHTYAALTSPDRQATSSYLSAAYRQYAAHTQDRDSYNAFYANYWAGNIALMRGDSSVGMGHLNEAYKQGERLLNNDEMEPRFLNDPQWDHRYDVAVILDTIAPALNGTYGRIGLYKG